LAQDDRATGMFTPLELQIMHVLWDKDAATVSEVQARLDSDLAYTTVQTMLNVLLRKKRVRRELAGRAFVYRPAVSQEKAMGTALDDLVARMFGGSAEAVLMALVDTRKVTPEALARATRLLKAREE
jgi:BlaI family penicillinase repressor